MSFPRLYVLLNGVVALAFGAAYFFYPVSMASLTELELPTAAAVIDIRAFYGGQLMGLGALAIAFAMRERLVPYGLWLTLATLGATGIARLAGASVEGVYPWTMVLAALMEIAIAGGALYLLIRPELKKRLVEAQPPSAGGASGVSAASSSVESV